MRNLLNPKWLLVINTVPIIILAFIFYGDYNIIKTMLSDKNIMTWKVFSGVLATMAFLNLAYTIYLMRGRKEVSAYYGFTALIGYIIFLYFYANHSDDIIPFSIPNWMVSDYIIVYVGTFLMPTLAYSLFILVIKFTPEDKEHKPWKNFLVALLVPITGYLFTQVVFPIWQIVEHEFSAHVIIILVISGTLIFLFSLIRGVYILSLRKSGLWFKYQLLWKIPISVLFPLLGLAVNSGVLFGKLSFGENGVFGDFNSPWYYIIAVVNGLLICLPNPDNKFYRLALFAGRSFTFSYTFYFFLVFLPYLPFSVVAIIALGIGFLMLTPLVLMIIHSWELSTDFNFLRNHFSKTFLLLFLAAGFLILPAAITLDYLHDKKVLNETLDYLYTPDYSKSYEIDKSSLTKTLAVVENHKERGRGSVMSSQTPYLSSFFDWLVLDNMTLSDKKINMIEKVFFGKESFGIRSNDWMGVDNRAGESLSNQVEISGIKTNSTFDKQQKSWRSWVDLSITNHSSPWSEYSTTFDLPDGCWISDYYLYVGDKKEPGILAEKKAATWIYSQIVNTNRDPGILYYLTGNKVAFRIFPFDKKEIRKTGIEFIHKEPVEINIDGNIVALGNKNEDESEPTSLSPEDNVVYISSKEKGALEEVQRTPYYHFIVDASGNNKENKNAFIRKVEAVLKKSYISASNAQISFTNSYSSSIPFDNNWKNSFSSQTFEGGFYLDRAIKKILFDSYAETANMYPVLIVITDTLPAAIIENNFADFKIACPESDLFYVANNNGNLLPHSLSRKPLEVITDSPAVNLYHKVLAWPDAKNPLAYLPKDGKPSIVLKDLKFKEKEEKISEKNWHSALLMYGNRISEVFHPAISDKEWLRMIKHSFISKVMTPHTSYIVVETEAQKAMLMKKQEEVLSGNKSLDLGEDTQRMSEPGLISMLVLLGLIIGCRKIFRGK